MPRSYVDDEFFTGNSHFSNTRVKTGITTQVSETTSSATINAFLGQGWPTICDRVYDHSRSTVSTAAELHYAFGDQIDIVLNVLGYFVKKFMKGYKVWSFHVPMSIFALSLQIDCVSKPAVAQINDAYSGGFR